MCERQSRCTLSYNGIPRRIEPPKLVRGLGSGGYVSNDFLTL